MEKELDIIEGKIKILERYIEALDEQLVNNSRTMLTLTQKGTSTDKDWQTIINFELILHSKELYSSFISVLKDIEREFIQNKENKF